MLVFLDVETTGLEKKDSICSIALIIVDGKKTTTHYELINPEQKISIKAMSINHITNEMVKDAPLFNDSSTCKVLNELNSKDNSLISHNIEFDNSFLAKEGFTWQGSFVDTMKATKHLIPEAEFFSLQYLRYELQLYKNELELFEKNSVIPQPHNALSDALHVKLLYEYLLEYATHIELENLTFERALIHKFTFGKYSGKYIEYIATKDPSYLEWLCSLVDIDEDLRYSVKYYLNESR